jgi:hypothetical protein
VFREMIKLGEGRRARDVAFMRATIVGLPTLKEKPDIW